MKISIIGSGGWGIALSLKALSNNNQVVLYTPFEAEAKMLQVEREHKKLLPGIKIPEEIKITTSLSEVNGSDMTVIATPSFAIRKTASLLKNIECGIIVNVAKGFEKDTLLRLSEVIKEELSEKEVAVLSGPSHAEEVARDVPTTVVVSSQNIEVAKTVSYAFMGKSFRIYTNQDIIGVEVGGAVKNVIAVASGIENGLSLGDNTRAALITRGITEIARLGIKMGADQKTFMGLSGIGDLIVTCMSNHSRNNRFGNLVGQGIAVKEALERVGTVEGYYATATTLSLAKKYDVEMPITEQCYNILYQNKDPMQAVIDLMSRPEKSEENL